MVLTCSGISVRDGQPISAQRHDIRPALQRGRRCSCCRYVVRLSVQHYLIRRIHFSTAYVAGSLAKAVLLLEAAVQLDINSAAAWELLGLWFSLAGAAILIVQPSRKRAGGVCYPGAVQSCVASQRSEQRLYGPRCQLHQRGCCEMFVVNM